MSDSAYRHLGHLFGAYMHQDWNCEGKNWQDLVRNFAGAETSVDLSVVASEIDKFLKEFPDDAELHDQMYRGFACYYDPRPDLGGPTEREWLMQVSSFLRQLAS